MSERVRVVAPALRKPRSLPTATLLAALPLLAGVACAGPDARPKDELVRQGEVFLDPETLQPYTGTIFATFAHNPRVIAQRLSLRDGTYDGPSESYFTNRRLSSKEYYDNGRKHGPYEWYFDSGRLFERGTYRMGALEGPYEAYWESGNLSERGTYRAGEFDGPRTWYLDDELIELVTYVNGVVEGPYERRSKGGSIDLRGMLHQGMPCGTWLEGQATIEYEACSRSTQ